MERVNLAHLEKDLEALSEIGRTPEGGVSRPSFSEADLEARRWYLRRLEEAGLHQWIDPMGNIFARIGEGSPSVLVGSHLDSVPNGGRFDGALGVMAALECLRTIKERGMRWPSPTRRAASPGSPGARLSSAG